jgi:uncharacterized protein with HEPN domain
MPVVRSARARLGDIVLSIDEIGRFFAGKTFDDFTTDALVHDAVVRNLEIISEASRHLGGSVRAQTPEIQWRKVADIGHWLLHAYEGVSDRMLWGSIQDDLPALSETVQKLLANPDII